MSSSTLCASLKHAALAASLAFAAGTGAAAQTTPESRTAPRTAEQEEAIRSSIEGICTEWKQSTGTECSNDHRTRLRALFDSTLKGGAKGSGNEAAGAAYQQLMQGVQQIFAPDLLRLRIGRQAASDAAAYCEGMKSRHNITCSDSQREAIAGVFAREYASAPPATPAERDKRKEDILTQLRSILGIKLEENAQGAAAASQGRAAQLEAAVGEVCATWKLDSKTECTPQQRRALEQLLEQLAAKGPVQTEEQALAAIMEYQQGLTAIFGRVPRDPAVRIHNQALADSIAYCEIVGEKTGKPCTEAEQQQVFALVKQEYSRPAPSSEAEAKARNEALAASLADVVKLETRFAPAPAPSPAQSAAMARRIA